jgi:hypothetical protein
MASGAYSGPIEPRQVVLTRGDERSGSWYQQAWHALRAFLGISLALVLAFLSSGLALYVLESSGAGWLQPLRRFVSGHLFASPDVTGSFLDTVAGGFLTMTSIIVTMLLLVLQQTASNMGNLIFDQFMARRRNKLYAGLIVGTLVLALFVRSTVAESFNPVLGATVVLAVSVASIVLLLAFLFTIIEQMRPETIISDIRRSTLRAWKWQLSFAQRTRREPQTGENAVVELRSEAHGYLVALDIDRLAAALAGAGPDVEVLLIAVPGSYVSYYDSVAEVHAAEAARAREVAQEVGRAFRFARKREMDQDPGYGLEQLEMLAWTEISSAKQNPEVGLRAIHSLRDLISRWLMQEVEVEAQEPLPVVFADGLLGHAVSVLESLSTAALEAHQHQVLAEVLRTLDRLFERFPAELRGRAEELVLRLLPHLSGQVLTRELDVALYQVAATMERLGDAAAAGVIYGARQEQAAAMAMPASLSDVPPRDVFRPVRGSGFRPERS